MADTDISITNGITPTLWGSIREALRGSHQDFTCGSLNRSILMLAIPMVLEMVLESLFAVVDVFWVSRLGADAIATVGLTESVLTLVFAVGACPLPPWSPDALVRRMVMVHRYPQYRPSF